MTLTLPVHTWTPKNGVVKATGDDVILHHADDTSHTISWNIIHHVDEGVDPRFTVTVDIYDLQGDAVAQLTQEHVEAGEGDLAWDTDLPEENGVYAYRISAEHEHPGIVVCGPEPDKSWRLEISKGVLSDANNDQIRSIDCPSARFLYAYCIPGADFLAPGRMHRACGPNAQGDSPG